MSTVKLATLLAASVVIAGGGGYAVHNAVGWMMPTYTVLSKGSSNGKHTDANNVGKKYENYLVDPFDASNENWWNWAYRWWKYDFDNKTVNLSDEFENEDKIKYAFRPESANGSDDSKSLNKVCNSVYGKPKTDLTPTNNASDNQNKLNTDLWKYCSVLVRRPVTVAGNNDESYSGIGVYGNTQKDKLVSAKDSSNYLFWEIRNKEFFGENGNSGIGNGLNDSDSLFKKLYDDKDKKDRGTIKDTCERAYSLTAAGTSDEEKAQQVNVLKFCSFEGE
ncbi:hypothetical protein [Candidatus Mycoplasma haematohominis]|uniref:hypothetical protein n=1 Tax=Candidatus Mycoplasma haematohominis TaxID=1494318 RepID=UPI001C0A6F2B|nr:hypothetical protein [Candidatus Mycoplasma haemohominis]